jgi:hypothetical protein
LSNRGQEFLKPTKSGIAEGTQNTSIRPRFRGVVVYVPHIFEAFTPSATRASAYRTGVSLRRENRIPLFDGVDAVPRKYLVSNSFFMTPTRTFTLFGVAGI